MPYHVGMENARATGGLPSYDESLARVLGRVTRLRAEAVPLSGASGCVLAEAIVADRDQPPFNRSAMDGYAVRSGAVVSDRWYEVVTVIAAGASPDASADLSRGVSSIATGAALPGAYDAVIPVEQAQEGEGRVRFSVEQVRAGAHIHPRGADAKAGDTLIEPGVRLGAQHIGIAAAAGCAQPVVVRRPGVSLITTGDEVRPPATKTTDLSPQQVRNSNGPMLDALLQSLNVERLDHAHVRDDPQATLSALREATEKSDLVLTVGGVSAGRRDYVPWAVGELGFETVIKGVALQPGKPVFIAQACDGSGRLVVGLPGNPVSVLATAHLFAWPIIRAMSGLNPALPWRRVGLGQAVTPNPRREAFRSAELIGDNKEQVRVIGWKGSGDLAHTSRADGFVRLPMRREEMRPGDPAWFLPMIGGIS